MEFMLEGEKGRHEAKTGGGVIHQGVGGDKVAFWGCFPGLGG